MTTPKHVRPHDLQALDIRVAHQGGRVLYLEGAQYSLPLSLLCAEIPSGGGPPEHTHPYIEIFVVNEGRGRYTVDDEVFEAQRGDVVIVPADARRFYVNTGEGLLHHTAIHIAPVLEVTFVGGSQPRSERHRGNVV